MQLYFLRNGAPQDDALRAILDVIRDTRGLLRIAVAYFNHDDIAEALVERADRKQPMHLLLNSSDLVRPAEGFVEYEVSAAILRIVNKAHFSNGSEVRTLGLPGREYHNMHHKFAVGNDRVLFGSVNWTRAALGRNYEFLALERSPSIVASFQSEFDGIWNEAHRLEARGGALRVIVCPTCRSANSVDFESWGAHCINCGAEFRPKRSA